MIKPVQSLWSLSDELVHYIITAFFEQEQPDSTALISGILPNGKAHHWLYTAGRYYPISLSEHDTFRQAAKSRGSDYSLEICEFTIEELRSDGDIVLNYWRRIGDDSGEGGRVELSHRRHQWITSKILNGWEKRP